MILLIATMIALIIETALATYVTIRSWGHRPALLFVCLTAALNIVHISSLVRYQFSDPQIVYASLTTSTIMIGMLGLLCMLFFSALFAPEWWEPPYAVRWIALPYVLIIISLCIDLLGRARIFTDGLELTAGVYALRRLHPAADILTGLFSLSWVVVLGVLGVAFVRRRDARRPIILAMLAIVFPTVLGLIPATARLLSGTGGPIQSVPLLVALAYMIIRTQLLTPTRAGLGLALRAMSEAVAVIDRDGKVTYANPQAAQFGLEPDQPAALALGRADGDAGALVALISESARSAGSATQILTIGTRKVEFSVAPIADARRQVQGTLLLGRDITEIEQRNAMLEHERERLAATVRELEAGRREREQLAATVQKLSLPLIPVLDGVLVLPLIGAFDLARAEEFAAVLLAGIERERARLVLIDITGMPLLDSDAAAGLLAGVRAARLLGARCVLAGVRPEIAQSLVSLNVSLGELATAATLQQALVNELGFVRQG